MKGCPGERSRRGCSPTTACRSGGGDEGAGHRARAWRRRHGLRRLGATVELARLRRHRHGHLRMLAHRLRTAIGNATTPAARPAGAASTRSTNRPKTNGPITPSPTSCWPIRSCGRLPGVDPDRIGVTGISWGGYLTCIVAGVDPRFRFAAPVYGCGFLGDNSAWLPEFQKMGPEKIRPLARLVGPVGLAAADKDAHALGDGHERFFLSDGFAAKIVPCRAGPAHALPSRAHAARTQRRESGRDPRLCRK